MRLACLYAVADLAVTVAAPDLEAVLECWRYCYESCRMIFGSSLGDAQAAAVLALLKQAGSLLSARPGIWHGGAAG